MKNFTPSLHMLTLSFNRVVRRFPFAVCFAVFGTVAALIMTTYNIDNLLYSIWTKAMLCCELGLVFSIAFRLFLEKRAAPNWQIIVRLFILTILLAGYFFSLQEQLHGANWYRFFLLAAFGHLAVAVVPFLGKNSVLDFWHYNKTLFLAFLTAVLYSAVLFAGICLAVFAVNELFHLSILDKIYFRIWIVMAGIVNTFIFLSGVPSVQEEKLKKVYPRGLKIFTQYVLIPLVSLYVLILLVYELKIVLQGELPNGWVSNLIIAFTVSGILSLLLIYPVRKLQENRWIIWYGKLYYLALIPLTILLFFAIGIRIANYGFTEERFFVLATGVWLVFMIGYFLFSKKENIKVIPLSLMAIILITLFLITPVCRNSQQERFKAILLENNIFNKGYITTPPSLLPISTRDDLTSIIRYLYSNHGVSAVQPFFETDLTAFSISAGSYSFGFADSALNTVNIQPVRNYQRQDDHDGQTYFSVRIQNNTTLITTGYDYYLSGGYFGSSTRVNKWIIDKDSIDVKMIHSDTLTFWRNKKQLIAIPLGAFLQKVTKDYGYQQTPMELDNGLTLSAENNRIKVKVILQGLHGYVKEEKMDFSALNLRFNYLVKFK